MDKDNESISYAYSFKISISEWNIILFVADYKSNTAHTRSINIFYLITQTSNYAINIYHYKKIIKIVNNHKIDPFCSIFFHSFKNILIDKFVIL